MFKLTAESDKQKAYEELIATARIATAEILLFEACQESLTDHGEALNKLNCHFKAMKQAGIAATDVCPAIWAFAQKVVKGIVLEADC